ncbi:uncharacterized protein ATNIH1004_009195 [Aspergillus tanneri]|uniref:Rhodopsin domain-containing protein n=1 Tax=Aspergillus tanneri TaxID=1220188 RepID=A0A5M9MI21_9EURO|nr:uncharacterized protein ATNIH1004_009195 [Aspergillus tanneri]KAA8644984.1 hypothetical protein ATNIH1004_009195 [Aspergillus tanneri]
MGYNGSAELFAEWAIGLVVIAVRFYARWNVGKRSFYWDDLCLGFATVFWTFHTIFLYYCTDVYGSNIGLTEKTAMEVPDDMAAKLRKGSIFAFIAWLSYIFMVWSFKGVLMFLYSRLTMGLWQHRLAQIVGVACVCTFLTSLFFHLFICYPVHRSWQVKPYAGDNCTIRPLNYIVIETLSIVTDLGIMSVPIPLVLAARIPTSQKIFLCALFSSGVFVMVAAFLRAYYSVKDINTLSTALGWASREALVSVFIVCAPGIKPLFAKFGWFGSYASHGYGYKYGASNTPRRRSGMFNSMGTAKDGHPYEMSLSMGRKKRESSAESQERIVGSGVERDHMDVNKREGIMVTTDVTLAHEDSDEQVGRR